MGVVDDIDKEMAVKLLDELEGIDPERIVQREQVATGIAQCTLNLGYAKWVASQEYDRHDGEIPYSAYIAHLKNFSR